VDFGSAAAVVADQIRPASRSTDDPGMRAETQAENERIARRNADLVARCDQQHEALMNDDITLGMYGEFPPPEGLK